MEAENLEQNGLGNRVIKQLLADAPVYAIVAPLFAVCLSLQLKYDTLPDLNDIAYNFRLYFAACLVLGFGHILLLLARDRPQSPIAHIRKEYTGRLTDPRTIASLPAFVLIVFMMPLFSAMKSMISLFNAYSWDTTFIAWDRFLFFGNDAWEVMQPVLGYPIVTATLAFFYHLWILIPYVGTIFVLFYRVMRPVARQYLLSFFMSWALIGGLMATLLASVGPCFMEPLLGDPTFVDQMAYLNAANEQFPIMTLRVQALLVEWYQTSENGLGAGITAMPSMHVAIALLFWLAVRKVSPLFNRLLLAFFVMTWVSSVHLAYHYAVDGLVSVIAVIVIWKFAGAVLQWWDARIASPDQPALRTNTVPAE